LPQPFFERLIAKAYGGVDALLRRAGKSARGAGSAGAHSTCARSAGARSACSRIETLAGVILLLYFLLFAFIAVAVFLDFMRRLHPYLYYIFTAFILCRVFNARTAADKAASARGLLKSGDTAGARAVISGLSKNCLEGVIAPMIFAALGAPFGVPAALAAAYKTLALINRAVRRNGDDVNNIGSAAARLGHAVNFLPARLCGLTLPLLAPACGAGAAGIARGFRATRDAHAVGTHSHNYTGSNDAWPEAAIFAILDIHDREAETSDIRGAITLTIASSLAAAAACCVILLCFAVK
jgi:cobalamin biosynthesis protein CobD/CbiB